GSTPFADDLGRGLADHLQLRLAGLLLRAPRALRPLLLVCVAHLSSPFISEVGTAANASCSRSSSSLRRCGPSLPAWIFSWSLMNASKSISGRGGQPGRYMSTGTTWSTPCTIA